MTRSVYLLAFIASATVVSAYDFKLNNDQGCAHLAQMFQSCASWNHINTKTTCDANPSCSWTGSTCTTKTIDATNDLSYSATGFRTTAQKSCYTDDAESSKTGCLAANSVCVWGRDSAFENKPGGCQPSQNSFVAANTAENAPEPYLFYIKFATSTDEVCGPLGKDKATCESDARCEWDADTDEYVYYCSNDGAAYAKAMKGITCPEGAGKTPTCPNGKDCVCTDLDLSCTGSDDWSYKRGGKCGISTSAFLVHMSDHCPTYGPIFAAIANTTVDAARSAISPAGDVSRGALLFAALAALLALVM